MLKNLLLITVSEFVVKQLHETANMVLRVELHHDMSSDDTHGDFIAGLKLKRTFCKVEPDGIKRVFQKTMKRSSYFCLCT